MTHTTKECLKTAAAVAVVSVAGFLFVSASLPDRSGNVERNARRDYLEACEILTIETGLLNEIQAEPDYDTAWVKREDEQQKRRNRAKRMRQAAELRLDESLVR